MGTRYPQQNADRFNSEFEKVFRIMQTGEHLGKVVVKVDSNDNVQVRLSSRSAATSLIITRKLILPRSLLSFHERPSMIMQATSWLVDLEELAVIWDAGLP